MLVVLQQNFVMNTKVRLVLPDETYEQSYRSYIQELKAANEDPVPFVLGYDYQNFKELLTRFKNDALGVSLEDWQVPCSTYWLVDHNSNIVGVSNLRHRLNERLLLIGGHIGFGIRPSARKLGYGDTILRESLKKALDIGIEKVLVTCDKTNMGSARIIKKNGGVFQDEEYVQSEKDIVQRYWIVLQTSAG